MVFTGCYRQLVYLILFIARIAFILLLCFGMMILGHNIVGQPEQQNLFPTVELNALKDLYTSTNGEHWLWNGDGKLWNFTEPNPNPCVELWEGVDCYSNYSITGIDLTQHNLVGTIPPSIGNFSNLSFLFLGRNFIRGCIPDTIGNLIYLTEFFPYYNELTGSLPVSFYSLQNLNIFFAYDNYFSGPISPLISNMSSLANFYMDSNNVEGPLPSSLCNMSNLFTLSMSHNQLFSTLPACLGESPMQLIVVSLEENFLSGPLPLYLSNITTIEFFTINNNAFTGTISSNISNFMLLTDFEIQSNQFTGNFPSHFMENMIVLRNFIISYNHFTGPLPAILSSNLHYLQISLNHFTGIIPSTYVTQAPLLSEITLSSNQLTGTIPSEWGLANNLLFVDLSDNFLTGTIPTSIMPSNISNGWRKINCILLGNNLLSGAIDPIIGLNNVTSVNISTNLFSGGFCDYNTSEITYNMWQYSFHNISSLDISTNIFTGTCLSHLVMYSHDLITLSVANNQFSGTLDHVFPTKHLATLDLSNNRFTGTIPSRIFEDNTRLISISLLKNCLTGSLPVESMCGLSLLQSLALDGLHASENCQVRFFSTSLLPAISTAYRLTEHVPGGLPSLRCLFNISSLQTLHLSGNAITGTIPSDLLISSTLQDLSLSYNQLTGTIPLSFQNKSNWKILDISFNKLNGNLQNTFAIPPPKASIKMTVNRLSGTIPFNLRDADSIEILQGNIFDCDNNVIANGKDETTRKRKLPVNDQYAVNYNCGSDSVNVAIYVWISVMAGIPFLSWIVWRSAKWNSLDENHWLISTWKEYYDGIFKTAAGIQNQLKRQAIVTNEWEEIGEQLNVIQNTIIFISIFTIIVLLPTYSVLSIYFSTHSSVYIWIISIAYLSGLVPAVVLMVVYFCFFLIFAAEWKTLLFTSYRTELSKRFVSYWSSKKFFIVNMFRRRLNIADLSTITLYGYILLSNAVVVLGVNVFYVYIITLNLSSVNIFFVMVAFSAFKIVWGNLVVLTYYSKLLHVHFHSFQDNDNGFGDETNEAGNVVYFLSCLLIFNNIIAPFVADALIDPNCFYFVIQSPLPVTVSYNNYVCVHFTFATEPKLGQYIICDTYEINPIVSSYAPPFLYSYQCTSALLNSFVGVFIYRYLLSGFINPLVSTAFKHADRQYGITSQIANLLRNGRLCSGKNLEDSAKHVNEIELQLSTVPSIIEDKIKEINVDVCLQTKEANDDGLITETFITNIIGDIAVLVTFGMTFPPLACVIAATIILNIQRHRLSLISFHETKRTDIEDMKAGDELNSVENPILLDASINLHPLTEDSVTNITIMNFDAIKSTGKKNKKATNSNILALFLPSVPVLCLLSSSFLGLFIYEIASDKEGLVSSLWILFVVVSLPLTIWCIEFVVISAYERITLKENVNVNASFEL